MIENDIARVVVKRMTATDGIYVPPELKPNRFTHFATDNLDFMKTHRMESEPFMVLFL
jgi:hypothetical protein